MPDNPKVEIINPPPNEPQPDRQAQLDNDLSKLFDSADAGPKVESKPAEPRKSPDKVEAPKEEKKAEPKAEDKSKLPEPEKAEIDDSKPKTKEGWKVLRDNYEKSKKTLAEKDAELAKLKATLAEKGQLTSQEAENLKKEIEDLKSYRAMVDVQADPEFISKFDDPILEKQKEVEDILTNLQVGKHIIDQIDYTDSKTISLIAHTIREKTQDDIAAEDFMSAARAARDLINKRNKHLQEYKGKYKEIIETKKKESFAKQAENEGRMQKHLESIAQMKNEHGELRFEFLVDKVAKDPTNQAEVAQVEQHNKVYAAIREQVSAMSKAETPEEKMEVAVAAGYAKLADAKLRAAMKKIESLQSELAKVSKVSSETPKTQRARVSSPESNGNGEMNLDLDQALSNFRATI